MKTNQSHPSSAKFVIAAAIVGMLGTLPMAAAHAGNMRTKQATRVTPALSSNADGAGASWQGGKRTPLRLGRTQRATAKAKVAQRAEVARAAESKAREQRESQDTDTMVRMMGGSLIGATAFVVLYKVAESFGFDATYVSSLSPTAEYWTTQAVKVVFGAITGGTMAMFYQAGVRKHKAEEASAAQP